MGERGHGQSRGLSFFLWKSFCLLFYMGVKQGDTLRAEQRLRVSENRVLKRICGPERDEVTVEWRKLHNEELNDLYSSPNIVRVIKSRIRWVGHGT